MPKINLKNKLIALALGISMTGTAAAVGISSQLETQKAETSSNVAIVSSSANQEVSSMSADTNIMESESTASSDTSSSQAASSMGNNTESTSSKSDNSEAGNTNNSSSVSSSDPTTSTYWVGDIQVTEHRESRASESRDLGGPGSGILGPGYRQ